MAGGYPFSPIPDFNFNFDMRNLFFIVLFFICMGTVVAQSAQPQTVQAVQATVSPGGNADHFYAAVGQPFFQQKSLGGYELSMGVAQAQWVRDTVYDVITYNTPYTKNGFDLSVPIESHKDSVYLINGGIYNYDLWRTLYLIVCPQYMASDYDVLAVSGYCWTKQNLRISADGAVTYQSPLGTNVPEVYGLLYPQTAAQTLCPEGWHLPMVEEVAALSTNPAITLRSTEGWVNGDINTNSTDFTAYPAGFYNANTQRFEGLGSETYWWTTGDNGNITGNIIEIPYYCDAPIYVTRNANDKLSVRCVKTNVWPE